MKNQQYTTISGNGKHIDLMIYHRSMVKTAVKQSIRIARSELPEVLEIYIKDHAIEDCSPGELQMNMQELDAATQYLRGLGYDFCEVRDDKAKGTCFRFHLANQSPHSRHVVTV